jgi:iron(III) transport system ATP-binding protein
VIHRLGREVELIGNVSVAQPLGHQPQDVQLPARESGRVRQIGTPEEIYHRPATRFVATFIGRSNVLDLPVIGAGADKLEVRLPDGTHAEVSAPDGHGLGEGDVAAVSIRPEHITLTPAGRDGSLTGVVTSVEFTGMATNLGVEFGGTEVQVAAVDLPNGLVAGERIGLVLPPSRMWVVSS